MKYFIILLSVFYSQISLSQFDDFVLNRGIFIYSRDETQQAKSHEKYLFNGEWNSGMIKIKGGKENLLQEVRYETLSDELEVCISDKVYSVNSDLVEYFNIENGIEKHLFINRNLKVHGLEKTTYIEVLLDGEPYSLYKYKSVVEKKANYNPILQTGSKTNEYKMSYKIVYARVGQFIEIPNSNKKAKKLLKTLDFFDESYENSGLDLTDQFDLITLFKLINLKNNENEINK